MQHPLVTVICLSFNHSKYLPAALNSIWRLNYSNVQLIVADDASTDNSQQLITKSVDGKEAELVFNTTNLGYCKTFNKALKLAKGDFVIDLAGDDVLLPNSVQLGVNHLTKMGDTYGVFFADAIHIDNNGREVSKHITSSFFYQGNVPQGNIYAILLGKYFINPVTMIVRRQLLEELKGYDEELSYEDFDFWVRSSRITNYCYLPEITVQKRIHIESTSSKQYIKNSKMLISTLAVCKKAYELNTTKAEDVALFKRLAYEAKMAFTSHNVSVAFRMLLLSIKVFFKIRL